MAKKSDFVHLHVHSQYSLLDGLCKIPPLVEKVQSLGQTAIGLTDHGAMYGSLHFYNACKAAGIKPIIGCEIYVARNSRFDKQTKMGQDQAHMTLLAMNYEGYQNINRLVSAANFEGFSYKPRVDDELLEKYNKNIIATSGCMGSIVNKLILQGKIDEAKEKLLKYKTIFKDRFYIEIQAHPHIDELNKLTPIQVKLARELDIPLVATNDVHYIEETDAVAQDALICVQTRKLIEDTKRMSMLNSPDFYMRSTDEMVELFKEFPDAIENTVKIANQCDIEISTGNLIFPKYEIPKGETYETFLKKMSYERGATKFKEITPELAKRMDYELDIINTKGYAAYFLITQDFVNWAKEQGIGVGPGRGSAAGSLVSYCIGITDIDPIAHDLAFERFLNPERPTPPDIDLDFADTRRDEVIHYVANKYGHDHVAHVITFGKMEARVAIRDIGRVLGMAYEDPDKIAKLIPNEPGKKVSLEQAVQTVPELAAYYQQPKFRKLIDLAKKVEGNIRHSSVHAAAVIITDKPLPDYVAIQKDSRSGKTITQFDMYALDCNVDDNAIGLLKFDFLGLRNLSIIQMAIGLIKKQKKIDIDISKIPLDDQPTFDLLTAGDTMGVFQLESAGMRRVARTLRPNQFSDITAMVALYRPGPMDLIPKFIEGKHNPDSIEYPHESLIPILKETYGIMVYQEQIMSIAHVMAGYTLGGADVLRRAIGKKKKKLLDKNKKIFIEESVKKGYERATAQKVWGFIEAFANYGFNKAHAASYAMVAYQTAYLKANYPEEYITALMSIESASTSMNRDIKIAVSIENCKKMGIRVLPPHINKSKDDFTLEKDEKSKNGWAIRFGFNAIKNVGSAAIENILEMQKEIGEFTSLTQFIHESDGRKVNKTTLESLIKVGAMDDFGTRSSMLENLENIRKSAAKLVSNIEGQDSLFGGIETSANQLQDSFPQIAEYPQQELLSFEKELLGLFLTDHPLATQLRAISGRVSKEIDDLDASLHANNTFMFGGVLSNVRIVQTRKSGKDMAFGKLEDATGSIDVVFFPKTYEEYREKIISDTVVLIKAKVDYRDEELQLLAEKVSAPKMSDLTHEASGIHKEIFIPRKTSPETLKTLGTLLKQYPGNESVLILIPNGTTPQKLLLPYGVKWSKNIEIEIAKLLN